MAEEVSSSVDHHGGCVSRYVQSTRDDPHEAVNGYQTNKLDCGADSDGYRIEHIMQSVGNCVNTCGVSASRRIKQYGG